jgi:hypothetical protein
MGSSTLLPHQPRCLLVARNPQVCSVKLVLLVWKDQLVITFPSLLLCLYEVTNYFL